MSSPDVPSSPIAPEPIVYEFLALEPDEPANANAALLAYIQLGPDRTLAEVARLQNISLTTVKRWASLYRWRDRVRQYQARILQQRMDALAKTNAKDAVDWAERTSVVRETEWHVATKLLTAAFACIENIMGRDPDKMTMTEIARALDIASKMRRRAAGLNSDHNDTGAINERAADAAFDAALAKTYGGQPDPDYPA